MITMTLTEFIALLDWQLSLHEWTLLCGMVLAVLMFTIIK